MPLDSNNACALRRDDQWAIIGLQQVQSSYDSTSSFVNAPTVHSVCRCDVHTRLTEDSTLVTVDFATKADRLSVGRLIPVVSIARYRNMMVAFLYKQIDNFLKFVHQVVDYNQIAVFFGQSFYEFRVYFLVCALAVGVAPYHFTRAGKNQVGSEQFSYKNRFPTTRRPGDYASEGAFQSNVRLFQIHPTVMRVCG